MEVFWGILKALPLIVEQWKTLQVFFAELQKKADFKARQEFIAGVLKGAEDVRTSKDPRNLHNTTQR